MTKTIWRRIGLLLLLLASGGLLATIAQSRSNRPTGETGTLERIAATNGLVSMRIDGPTLRANAHPESLRFEVGPNMLFTALVFDGDLRGTEQSAMELVSKSASRSALLGESLARLVVEKGDAAEPSALIVRDAKSGFVFFRVEGESYTYDPHTHVLRIDHGRLLASKAFAQRLSQPAAANTVVGEISVVATMSPIEITQLVNGEPQSDVLPARALGRPAAGEALSSGPDVIVGDLPAIQQFGSDGSVVGLAIGTVSCNLGNQQLDWFKFPNTDHPVIPQNLYRMSGGANNTDRFEQLGQSWVKHGYSALQQNACALGCTAAADSTHLGTGCSDPYDVSFNGSQSYLGSRAWINPFTGSFPSTAATHTNHVHTGVSHRIAVQMSDLDEGQNAGASYFAESLYITPHEYAWCQAHPGQCNMYNNASYRQFRVSGQTNFFNFIAVAPTVRMSPAIMAWTGATVNRFEPAPGTDGIGFVGYKVTNPSAGVWHYEYAVFNQNLDRAIQSFSVPLGCGVTTSNLAFHAPPNEPAFTNDGTTNDAGFSNAAWTTSQSSNALAWSSETFAQNPNANAIRWGTLYNFRFDSNRPPQATNATLGFLKTGSPITVAIQGPAPDACAALQLTSAASRRTHGMAGIFDIDLPLTGAPGTECRTGGATHDYTLVFTFTNSLTSGQASITSGTGSVSGSPTMSGNTMVVNLTGVADQQKITVTLSNVTDSFGQVLPNTSVSANFLLGDTNGSKAVDATDISQVKAQSGAKASASNFRTDVDLSGLINATDISTVKSQSGSIVH